MVERLLPYLESAPFNYVSHIRHAENLLVHKRRAEVKDEGSEGGNAEDREEVSAEVRYVGGDHLTAGSINGEHVDGSQRSSSFLLDAGANLAYH